MRLCLFVVSISLIATLLGCGTMANLEGKRYPLFSVNGDPVRVYGGVRNDFRWIAGGIGFPESSQVRHEDSSLRKPVSVIEDPMGFVGGLPLFTYFVTVDPVLSFVGDTLTLPVVLMAHQKNQPEDEPTDHMTSIEQTSLEQKGD